MDDGSSALGPYDSGGDSLRPWYADTHGSDAHGYCLCDCPWTAVLSALIEAGPFLWCSTAQHGAQDLATALAHGRSFALSAQVTELGIHEALEWIDAAGAEHRVHALPSTNWRAFDRLAQRCGQRAGSRPCGRSAHALALPLLIDWRLQITELRWWQLTQLDQEHAQDFLRQRGLRGT